MPVFGLIRDMRELRIPSDLPQEAIRIREISGITTPVGTMPRLHEPPAALTDLSEHCIDFVRRANVVSKGESREATALG